MICSGLYPFLAIFFPLLRDYNWYRSRGAGQSNVDKKSEKGEQSVQLCNYLDVYNNNTISNWIDFMEATASENEIKRFSLEVGDVIITKDSENPNDIGIPAIVVESVENLVCGYHLTILRPSESSIHGLYLFYALSSRLSAFQFYLAANGVTRFGLTYHGTKNLIIALPEITEQRQIADFLDWKTGQIDELITKKKQLIEKLKEKRIALITQTVTKGLDSNITMRDSGIPWLGKVPEHWDIRKLKFTATYNDESLPETTEPDYEISYVDISSVDLVDGITAVNKVIFEEAPSRARRVVQDGDTIISTVRTYLKAIAYIDDPPENMIVSTGFAVIRPLSSVYQRFLSYVMQNTSFIDTVVANSEGVSYPAINPSTLVCIHIAYPEARDEQHQIVDFLDKQTKQIDELVTKNEQLIEKLIEYRTALITAAVTGKLDVRKVEIGGNA